MTPAVFLIQDVSEIPCAKAQMKTSLLASPVGLNKIHFLFTFRCEPCPEAIGKYKSQ
ncbi:MAG: hypothetical protein ACTSRP_17545 [Candidatus Helarchaeota archaeon]